MATVILNGAENQFTPTEASKGTSSVMKAGGYVFFSDNPESVESQDLADSGKWLLRDTVTGSGFVYSWHQNNCGYPIQHALSVYNPNSYAIRVTSANFGTSNVGSGSSDSEAWEHYFKGINYDSKVINPNSYGTLFHRSSIAHSNNFGFLGQLNVTNSSSGAAASAVLYDIAWRTNSSGATANALPKAPEQRRGKGPTYYNTFYLQTIAPTTSNGIAYRILGSPQHPGIFGTDDLVYITDPTGLRSGYSMGGFGQHHAVNMTIRNNTNTSRKFHIYIGRPGPPTENFSLHVCVHFAGTTVRRDWLTAGKFKDVIATNTLAPGAQEDVSFFMAVPGMSSTPVLLGARAV